MQESTKSKRILICGHEIGGQMQLLAETLRKRGFEATAVAFNDDFRGYSNDINISEASGYNYWRRFWFANWAIRHFDVFHFFWGVSLFSLGPWHLLDLPLLKRLNKKIIVHFRGLDIVDIKYFDYRRAISRGEQLERPPISRKEQLKRLKKWQKYADHVLVSEPDLYEVTGEEAVLSPQIIDLNYWVNEQQPLSAIDGIFRVVHAPSSRRKKGTEFIEEAIANLQYKGHKIELILAENYQAHKIKELYAQADIGVDQLLYGWHGKVSVELMAMGIPVICYIDPEFRKYRPTLPIISSSPIKFKKLLEKIISDKTALNRNGQLSRAYVYQFHDVEKEVDKLLELYGNKALSLKISKKLEDVKTW